MINLWHLRRFLLKIPFLRVGGIWLLGLQYRPGRIYSIKRGPLTGCKWYMPERGSLWMPLGVYESQTASWLADKLEPGAEFWDIGANIGYFTLLGSKLVGGTGRVVAFEPVFENASIIRRQLQLNDICNCTVEEKAVGSQTGIVSFTIETNGANSHFESLNISHAQSCPLKTIDVKVETIDDYYRQIGRCPNLIKIDVEAAEYEVLAGAHQTLEELKTVFIISTHSETLMHNCSRLLKEKGYRVSELAGFEHELIAQPG